MGAAGQSSNGVHPDGCILNARMTRTTNARLAGFTFLLYIAAGIASLIFSGRATSGEGTAAKLASIAQHASDVRVAAVLILFTSFAAVVLGVTLYAITRDEDPDLAMLALICRVIEGVNNGTGVQRQLELLWLATAAGPNAPDTEAAHALGAFLFAGQGGSSAIFFAVGSTLFSWLMLRGRMIPVALAQLGVFASLLLVVILPLQVAGILGSANWFGVVTWLMWLPMLLFEVTLAVWLIVKGVAAPARRQSA
jgi:hypothetical protein